MFRILRVSGDSLMPTYQDGDFVIVSKIPLFFRSPRPGDVIVFQHAHYGVLIKKVAQVVAGGERLFVVGTHEHSVDSRRFGAIDRRDVLGKVVGHIPRPHQPSQGG